MSNLRSQMLLVATLTVFFLACQKPAVIEYVKYDNDAAVPRISAADAKKEFDAGNVIFVDSRTDGAFKVEHLPGAVNVAFGSPPESFDKLPKGKKIIIYCS